MTISNADANKLRGNRHSIELILNATPLVQVASARVNQSTFSFPLAQITVDNVSANWLTDVRVGMAYSIGTTAGGSDIAWGVVHTVPSSTVFFPDAKSLGDPGFARDIIQGIANDYHITIWQHRLLYDLQSAIRNKLFYKQWSKAYTNQGSSPDPVAMFGAHRQTFVDDGGTATLTFTATPFAWGSATITGHQFNCDTASVVGGSETTTSVTYEFEPGFHVVEYTATSSQSKTHSAWRYVWVNERTGENAPFGSQHEWEINSDTQDENGRRVTITLYGNYTPEDVYPGQAFMLTENASYNGETLDDEDARNHTFFGYVAERSISRSRTTPSIEIVIESPLVYARRVGNASQLMEEKASPANWTQVTSALSHPPGAAWYLMHWHCPNLLAGHDFSFPTSLKNLRRKSFEFSEGTIGGQLDQLKELMLGNIGCTSDGAIIMAQSGNYMSNTDRNALDVKFTWNEFDLQPPLDYPFSFAMPTSYVKGGAFAYSGGALPTPYLSRAPGTVQAQGSRTVEMNFIVTAAEGQDRVNAITGHLFAEASTPTSSFSITGNRNIDICEPARVNVWHRVNIPVGYDPAGEGWDNKRVLPTRVSRSYRKSERGTVLKTVQVEFKPETFGQPGITVPVERGGAANQLTPGGYNIQQPVYYDPVIEGAFALVWTYDGRLARSHNFNSSTPHYETIDAGMTGDVNDVAINYGSDYFQTGTGALGAWAVTTSNTSLHIYYAEDVRTVDPDWQEQAEYTMDDATVETSARIQSSKGTTTFVIAAWRTQSGTKITRTENAGADWDETPTTVGSSVTDTANDDAPIGLAVDGVIQLVTAPETASEYHLYMASAVDGSFTKVTDSVASIIPHPFITVDGQGNAYTRTQAAVSSDVLVTFDDGTYEDYVINGSNSPDASGEVAEGNPGNAARATWNSGTLERNFKVCVTLPSTMTLPTGTTIRFDWKIDWGTRSASTLDFIRARIGWQSDPCNSTDYGFDQETTALQMSSNLSIQNVWQSESYTLPSDQTLVQTVQAVVHLSRINNYLDVELFIDNVEIDLPTTVYRVGSYTTSPAWTDITPTGNYEPIHPYAFSVDGVNKDRVSLVGVDTDDLEEVHTSNDNGDTWDEITDVPSDLTGIKTGNDGELILLWGDDIIQFSDDAGANFVDKTGDIDDLLGSLDIVKGMAVF